MQKLVWGIIFSLLALAWANLIHVFSFCLLAFSLRYFSVCGGKVKLGFDFSVCGIRMEM
jgi:hypothetical protein